MAKKEVSRQRRAFRLLDQAVKRFAKAVEFHGSYQPSADTLVTTFQRGIKQLAGILADGGVQDKFWSLHHKIYLRLLKATLKLRQ